jgi:hypothetical protein
LENLSINKPKISKKQMKKLLTFMFAALFTQTISAQSTEKYQKYLGEYEMENAPVSTIIISIQDGSLWGEAVGQGESELMSTETENTFELESIPGAKVVFSKENNIINALELIMDQGKISGKRLFPSISEYTGIYTFEPGGPLSKLTITNEDGNMKVSTSEFGETIMTKTSKIDVFLEPNYQSDFNFKRNEAGEVSGLNIEVASQGISMKGIREMPLNLDFYAGAYEFPDMGFSLSVENRDGRIYAFSDQGEGYMDATDKAHTFKADGMDVSLEFVMDSAKKISNIILNYQGQPMKGIPKK